MLKIGALEKLVQELAKLPGVGPKTAQRYAYSILKKSPRLTQDLSNALLQVQAEVHECPECFNYTDLSVCRYCTQPNRNESLLCVVEEPSDILRIESSGAFKGRYHVLHGVISPLEGIFPNQIKASELFAKVDAGLNGLRAKIDEVILALDSDIEGDATALYLAQHLKQKSVRLSRLAHGVPIGGDLDYVDERTMSRALENRVDV